LHLSAENAHRDQRTTAHEDNLDIQTVLGKDAGVLGELYGQEMGRICHRKADALALLGETGMGDARDEK
jgi:hypothetical protein